MLASNEKFQNSRTLNDIENKNNNNNKFVERSIFEGNNLNNSRNKFTSLANINVDNSTTTEVTRNKEKFSQWRDNILKRQEEPTPEKQLLSLQV